MLREEDGWEAQITGDFLLISMLLTNINEAAAEIPNEIRT